MNFSKKNHQDLKAIKCNKRKILKQITFLLLILLSIKATAQQGINYKALIKDGGGNVIANENITVQFTILEGGGKVYQEIHNPMTDANGIIIINIGEGTPGFGLFSNIDWSTNDQELTVEIDTGSGLVDMGTSAFKNVPFAIQANNAETAVTALNVTGLEALNEGNGIGYRIIGKDPANYGNIGLNAIGLSNSSVPSSTNGATGDYATVMGSRTTASGVYATAMGLRSNASGTSTTATGQDTSASGIYATAMGLMTNASGNSSTAMGQDTSASGSSSTAMGQDTSASGNFATAIGFETTAISFNSLAIGRYNTISGSPAVWISSDPLFVIGNGSSSISRSNALTVLKNGTIIAPTLTNTLINTAGNKALISKEYADTNYNDISTGLEALDEGNGIGHRIIDKDPTKYGNIGLDAVDLSDSFGVSTTRGATGNSSTAMGDSTTASGFRSTAMGTSTIASGDNSTTMGQLTTASGGDSTAMGNSTIASGTVSTAIGNSNVASGFASTAMGQSTAASGNYSTSMGQGTIAASLHSVALGRYNLGGGNPTTWVATDPLFEIGNGASFGTRANALTVLKSGKIGIGTSTPIIQLQIEGGSDASLANDTSGYLLIGDVDGDNIVMDNNEIMARSNALESTLFLQQNGGAVAVNGAVVHASDRRLKNNISTLNYGLDEILQLKPVSYNWKNRPEKTQQSLGLIAQDLKAVISELVQVENDKEQLFHVNYTELIPVLIKAIQEQQEIINSLKSTVDSQQSVINKQDIKVEAQNNNYEKLLKRVEYLEANSNQ